MVQKAYISGLENAVRTSRPDPEDFFALGEAYFHEGRYEDLLTLYDRMADMDLSSADQAAALSYQGVAHVCLCNWAPAIEAFERALDVLETLTDDEEEIISLKGFNCYDLSVYCEDESKGVEYAAKALHYLTVLEEKFPSYPHMSKVYAHLADLHNTAGDFALALRYYDRYYKLGRGCEDGVWALSGMAGVYAAMGDYEKSLTHYKKALAEAPPEVPVSKIYYDLGETHFQYNMLSEAEAALKTAMKFREQDPILGPNEEYEISILWRLGTIAYELENDDEMIDLFESLLDRIDSDHAYFADINLRLGHYYSAALSYPEAARYYNQVLLAVAATVDETVMARNCLEEMPMAKAQVVH